MNIATASHHTMMAGVATQAQAQPTTSQALHHAHEDAQAATAAHCDNNAANLNDACSDYDYTCPLCPSACGSAILNKLDLSCSMSHTTWPRPGTQRAAPPTLIYSLYRPPNRA
ncbi:MAG: hypothetical protein LBV36_05145 [Chromatiales bacterium]|jgi:hypothetical protein|nr:hypothetical protein [Chromatiales bacterium]